MNVKLAKKLQNFRLKYNKIFDQYLKPIKSYMY